jgi:hypothetical protein
MTRARKTVAFKTPFALRNIKQGVSLACLTVLDKMDTFYTEGKINQAF